MGYIKKSKLEEAREDFATLMGTFINPTSLSTWIYKLKEKYEQAIEEIQELKGKIR